MMPESFGALFKPISTMALRRTRMSIRPLVDPARVGPTVGQCGEGVRLFSFQSNMVTPVASLVPCLPYEGLLGIFDPPIRSIISPPRA